jgi:aminopeptidase N
MAQTVGGATQRLILDGSGTITLPGCGAYVVNSGQSGYYRTLYPATNITALAKDFPKLPAIDQLGLMADNWALAVGDYQPVALPMALIDGVPATASQSVLTAIPSYLLSSYYIFEGDSAGQARVLSYSSGKLLPLLAAIGYDPKPGEGPQTPLLREKLVGALGAMGEKTATAEANRRFAALASDPKALDGPLKNEWLSIIARNADQATWEKLRAMANAAPTALEKSQLFAFLGEASDDALAAKALDLAMTDEPGKTTSAAIISAVSGDHSMMAVDYVLAHRQQFEAMIDVSARSQALARLGVNSADPAMITRLDSYATQYLKPESRKVIDRAIAAIKARIESRSRLKPAISAWLAKKG